METPVKDLIENCPNAEICAARIAAESDAKLHNDALKLSSAVLLLVIVSHIVFAWQNRAFPMPDIIWILIAAPWLGSGGAKIMGALARHQEKK